MVSGPPPTTTAVFRPFSLMRSMTRCTSWSVRIVMMPGSHAPSNVGGRARDPHAGDEPVVPQHFPVEGAEQPAAAF